VRNESVLALEQAGSSGHRRAALTIALALTLAFLGTLAIGERQLPRITAYVPILDPLMFLSHLLTATLLYSQYSVARQRSSLALAMGFLFAALIMVPHVLTFPGDFAPTGLLGANVDTSLWLYWFCRLGIFTAVIAYSLLKEDRRSVAASRASARATISSSILAVTVVVFLLTLLAIHGINLPPVMLDPIRSTGSLWSHVLAPLLIVMNVTAITLLWRHRRGVLAMWLLVAQWAWLMETVLLALDRNRFSVFWYGGHIGQIASCSVLLVLLYETTALYAQLARSAQARSIEGERQRLALQAVTASVTHELRQPLAGIIMNSEAARAFLEHHPPDLADAREAMDDLAADAHRASDIIGSINAALQGMAVPLTPVSIGEIVNEALKVLYGELRTNRVAVQLRLPADLPPVPGDHGRLMQVLVNLITNSIEAMASVTDRPRVLTIGASLQASGNVSVTVTDSGTGIGPDYAARIFEPFFTTKSGGSGLGLAVCRRIMEAHGGHISTYPGADHGSVFEILLPTT